MSHKSRQIQQHHNDSDQEHEIEDLSDDSVINFYMTSSQVCNQAIKEVIALCQEGKSIIDICVAGDAFIESACAKLFTKRKNLEKGIAFPTCVSINDCVGHFSPLRSEAPTLLKKGDIVKVDLGVQFDGYVAMGAHTIIVGGGDAGQPLTGRTADAICAAHFAMEAAIRLVKEGNKSSDVTKAITKIADAYHVTPVAGILSHDLKRWSLDGEKIIFSKAPTGHQRADEHQFETNEVYCIDIVMSTGDGKSKDKGSRTTVFKRDTNQNYQLKMKASKDLLHDINLRYPALPFTLRAFTDETKTRLGLGELTSHGLVNSFPVLYEAAGNAVVQFKATILLLPSGNVKITCNDLPLPFVSSTYSVDEESKAILALPLKNEKKKSSDKMDTN
ncbi:proliferation associated protein [Cavenderia fasciculata]|uniref:Proliferation associated protein n=1 Tax=Cavenderia fasciculata TaxID=261658 RepID=F4Q5K0_CACFS|nr:proliferation associated protein [Cavenderia fasciculata]EGG17259.1 proliferation associated protein [Cavenderia fasciculata]|eukprot:XP_004355743.1 proliferation associated protein [Cavenderia fasciculata]